MQVLLDELGMASDIGPTAAQLRRQILGVFSDARLVHTNDCDGELLRFNREPFGLRRENPKGEWEVCRVIIHPAAGGRPAWTDCEALVVADADTAVEFLLTEVAMWRLNRRRFEMESEAADA
jgi:hypothetical protein